VGTLWANVMRLGLRKKISDDVIKRLGGDMSKLEVLTSHNRESARAMLRWYLGNDEVFNVLSYKRYNLFNKYMKDFQ